MQLNALIEDLLLRVRDPILCHRRGNGIESSGDDLGNDVVDEQACDMRFGGQFGQLELRILKFGNCFPEGLAILDVTNGLGEAAFHCRDARDGNERPLIR